MSVEPNHTDFQPPISLCVEKERVSSQTCLRYIQTYLQTIRGLIYDCFLPPVVWNDRMTSSLPVGTILDHTGQQKNVYLLAVSADPFNVINRTIHEILVMESGWVIEIDGSRELGHFFGQNVKSAEPLLPMESTYYGLQSPTAPNPKSCAILPERRALELT